MEKANQNHKTIELVVEQKLQGVTLQMLDWWFGNIDKGYALWHPETHKTFQWEIPPNKDSYVGALQIIEDKIGKSGTEKKHVRYMDPADSPITIDADYVHLECEIGTNNEVLSWTNYECKPDYCGTLVRLKSLVPADTPQGILNIRRKHILEEMRRLPEFLPEMYKLWETIPPGRPPLRIQPLETANKDSRILDADSSSSHPLTAKATVNTIVDDDIYGVTPDMIDWWTDNMEKGYPLWHPEDHFSNEWIKAPARVGHLSARKLEREKLGDSPVVTLHGRYADPDKMVDFSLIYKHISGGGEPDRDGKIRTYLTHQYEATSYGTRMRTILHEMTDLPVSLEVFIKHDHDENGRFKDFLPQLYKMWQVVKDPTINVPCCLKYPYKDINKSPGLK